MVLSVVERIGLVLLSFKANCTIPNHHDHSNNSNTVAMGMSFSECNMRSGSTLYTYEVLHTHKGFFTK
jgi:hypothetical protein